MGSKQEVSIYRATIMWGEDQYEELTTGSPREIADKARAAFGNVTRSGDPLARRIRNACMAAQRGDHPQVPLPGGHEPVLVICPASMAEEDARAYVEASARDLIGELRTLELLTQGGRTLDKTQMLDCIDIEGPAGEDEIVEAAEDRMFSLPLAVEATTTFEVVLGCGGPDRRLCFECDVDSRVIERGENVLQSVGYEIRRVLYRYSWDRSAEIELDGEDREVAEAFGRRVVPELVE
jgi:hypothetical protein